MAMVTILDLIRHGYVAENTRIEVGRGKAFAFLGKDYKLNPFWEGFFDANEGKQMTVKDLMDIEGIAFEPTGEATMEWGVENGYLTHFGSRLLFKNGGNTREDFCKEEWIKAKIVEGKA